MNWEPDPDQSDPLAAARGTIVAVILSAPFWAAIIAYVVSRR